MGDEERSEQIEDLDIELADAEDVQGGCQNNLAEAASPQLARVSKVEALNIKQSG